MFYNEQKLKDDEILTLDYGVLKVEGVRRAKSTLIDGVETSDGHFYEILKSRKNGEIYAVDARLI